MSRRLSLVLAAALGAAGTLFHVAPAAATLPAVRLQAETATLGSSCGDGQAQHVYPLATGERVVFLGGSNCALTFGTTIDDGATAVRWFGGGHTGAVCGVFATVRNGTEIARTARTCSTAGSAGPDFQLATFPRHAMSQGPFQLVWIPETWWLDAHVDWLELDDQIFVRQAEGSTFSGSCDGQPVAPHTVPTGETVVTLGGAGCQLQYGTAGPNWVFEVRWYGTGYANLICGYFSAQYFTTEFARTNRTCSMGGGDPDFEVATFSVNDMTSLFQVVWVPENPTWDANVDWVSTAWTNGTEPAAQVTPAAVDFGMRAVGSTTDRTVTVRSIGTGPLFLAESSMWYVPGNTVFTPHVDGCARKVVWPNQTCSVVVRFAPDWAWEQEEVLLLKTSEGLHWAELSGDADEWVPGSTITTAPGAIIAATGTVNGTADDERAGVSHVAVTFTDLAGYSTTATATSSCNTGRLHCTWSVPVPLAPGRYTVNSRAYDRVGHVETPGQTITVNVV